MKKLISVMFSLIVMLAGCNEKNGKIDPEQLADITVNNNIEEITEGDFKLTAVSEKKHYKQGEPVQLYAEIEYIGEDESVDIFHSSSAVFFTIKEKVNGFEIGYAVNDIGLQTKLIKNQPFREIYEKTGGYSEHSNKAYVEFVRRFVEEEGFPVGYYIVEMTTDFSVGPAEDRQDHERIKLTATIDFKVEGE